MKKTPQDTHIGSLPSTLWLIWVFVLLPIICFYGVGIKEDSFHLKNNGHFFAETGDQFIIQELEENKETLFVLKDSAGLKPLDFTSLEIKRNQKSQNDWLILQESFVTSLPRCPKDTNPHTSCMVTNNGIFEDPIFLGYFFAALFSILAAQSLLSGISHVRSSLPRMVQKSTDENQGLSQDDVEALVLLYSAVEHSSLPWKKGHLASQMPPKHQAIHNRLRLLPLALSLGGLAFLCLGTHQHWYAQQTYGFDIWASSNHPLGFYSRLIYEALLYTLFFPLIFYWLFLSIFIMHHMITTLEEHNAVRFIRFSFDEAGGMGEFGNQSLRNVIVLLPLLLPIIAYILYYPVTQLLIIGLILFTVSLPLIFFWPLLGARRALIRLKGLEIDLLTENFERSYELLKEVLSKEPEHLERVKETSEALLAAEQVFREMNELPTWPFSRTLLAKFASVMTILLSGLAILLERM